MPVNYLNMFPDAEQRMKKAEERQQLAQVLMQQGMEPHKNEIVGGMVVPYSNVEGLTKLANALMGGYMQGKAQQEQSAISQDAQQRLAQLLGASPGIGSQPGIGSGAGALGIPGMSPDQRMMAFQMSPSGYMNSFLKQYEPTDAARRDRELGINTGDSRLLELGKRTKDATQQFSPGSSIRLPGGQMEFIPDTTNNMQGGFDAEGKLQVAPIPGAAMARGEMAGMVRGAEKAAETPYVVAQERSKAAIELDKNRLSKAIDKTTGENSALGLLDQAENHIRQGTLGNSVSDWISMQLHEWGRQTDDTIRTRDLQRIGSALITAKSNGSLGAGVSNADTKLFDEAAGSFRKAQSNKQRLLAISKMREIASRYILDVNKLIQSFEQGDVLPEFETNAGSASPLYSLDELLEQKSRIRGGRP